MDACPFTHVDVFAQGRCIIRVPAFHVPALDSWSCHMHPLLSMRLADLVASIMLTLPFAGAPSV